jgi:molybdopterin-guanine dinucleotide biosynthesis protein A
VVKSKLSFSAVLLAGGNSRRMGIDKASLTLGADKLIDISFKKLDSLFSEVIIAADRWRKFSYLPAKFTDDLIKKGEKSSLRGIHSGLSLSTYCSSFIIGCDMPFLSLPLIDYMSRFAVDFDIVVPRLGEYYQPLFAFYKKSTLESITRQLKENKLKLTGFYAHYRVREITEEAIRHFDPQLLSFFNVNTKENYKTAQKIYNESRISPPKVGGEINSLSKEGATHAEKIIS